MLSVLEKEKKKSSILQVRNAGFFIFEADKEKSSLSPFSVF